MLDACFFVTIILVIWQSRGVGFKLERGLDPHPGTILGRVHLGDILTSGRLS